MNSLLVAAPLGLLALVGCTTPTPQRATDAAATCGSNSDACGRDGGSPLSDGGAEPPDAAEATRSDAEVGAPFDAALAEAGSNDPDGGVDTDGGAAVPLAIGLSEVMTRNDGAMIDERGQAGDWLELANYGFTAVSLADYALADSSGEFARLPALMLAPGAVALFWADDDVEVSDRHLPFKLDGDGERLTLRNVGSGDRETLLVPALEVNESYVRFGDPAAQFLRCRYASPGAPNGSACIPPPAPSIEDDADFDPFDFPETYPELTGPLLLVELALRPAGFIEVKNISDSPVDLAAFQYEVAPTAPGVPWPEQGEGVSLEPLDRVLQPGERASIAVTDEATAALELDPAFEGVVSIFDAASASLVDRVDFMRWPEGAVLARDPEDTPLRFCKSGTRDAPNECEPVASREIGDRIRHLRTPGDFVALAAGEAQTGMQSAKFVIDREAGGAVHLLAGADWPLHYTWIRERIYGQPALDRCDPEQADEFYQGWLQFSNEEYFSVDRRFLLGTLVHHGGADLHAVEYTFGDQISASQMKEGFFGVVGHTDHPREWVLRPQDASQVQRARAIEGDVPLVGPNAPFAGVKYQPLTQGIAYGTLTFVPVEALPSTALGPRVIVVTDAVPNDIPLVGGLITEGFQTPLSHVNVLSQNRSTPNAALVDARNVLSEYLGKLVRLEVDGGGVHVSLADASEAQAFWDERSPEVATVAPRLDTNLRGVQQLAQHSLASLPAIGAKASQMAELLRVDTRYSGCPTSTLPIPAPDQPMAIPVVHSREHFAASGAEALLAELQAESTFTNDPVARAAGLERVQALIRKHPVDAALLAEVEASVEEHYGARSVRFRSSSNTEDLPQFNGAGLYTSTDAEAGNPNKSIADAIRVVWASLWNPRAYDERRYAGIDDSRVGMGVLIHPGFEDERANGVAVSRDVLDLVRGDIYTINAQAGEASITNPAPGVTSDQLSYLWNRTPNILYQSHSSLLSALATHGDTVLSEAEVEALSCALRSVHDWFRPLLDPGSENPYFAMEVEFKFMGPGRSLAIKQARPHSFGDRVQFADCREL